MKKALSLLLALVMCLSLAACGDNETELTLENYTNYLNISAIPLFTGKDWLMKPSGSPNSITCNSKAEYQMTATGASSNYDYNNVVVTVKVTAIYNTFSGFEKTENVEVSKELTITCDIGGSGTGQVVIFEGREQSYQIEKNSLDVSWEVVSVSGTVARIG